MTKRSFFPTATDNGLTQSGEVLCSTMQSFSKSSQMAYDTKSGCWKADLLLAKNMGADIARKEAYTHEW